MKSLLIIGAGEYGRLARELAVNLGYEKVDFLDDNSKLAIGKISELNTYQTVYDGAIVAIGNPSVREYIYRQLINPVTLVHPDATISQSAKIGEGCVVEAKAVISTGAEIGISCFICAGSVINHDAVVKEFSQVDCNSVVGSGAVVPAGTKIESCTLFNK